MCTNLWDPSRYKAIRVFRTYLFIENYSSMTWHFDGKQARAVPLHLFCTPTIILLSKLSNLNSTNSKVHHDTDNAFRLATSADKIIDSMSSQTEVEVNQIDGGPEVQMGEELRIKISEAHWVRTPVRDPLNRT